MVDPNKYLNLVKSNYNAELADVIIKDDKFQTWSGSAHEDIHHYGDGGLLQHTFEVVHTSLQMAKFYELSPEQTEDLFFAALFHDIGKTFDYNKNASDNSWYSTNHKYKVYHITRSGIIWHEAATKVNYPRIDNVLHAILAHHGRREWGSPVTPANKVAWILHLCDNMSARVCDTDKNIKK